ncbi:hypothetical protein I4F81_012552 [Pyropia yezoensis]|uniref:Uncharacterized protein n=1 Tax=Pyropia yezoensis TaxID=2788 RepID=A0ACC3CIP4_PYRYE|nr:hypothetical protein I4F81_012552 [Neopyropia yezoensis]
MTTSRPADRAAPPASAPALAALADDLFRPSGRVLFELGQVLGRGGYGTVVLARNVRTGALVAIKRFHTDGPAGALGAAALHAIADKERRIWVGLRHRNVVAYEGCFTGAGGELNLVVEYVDGWSLADHVAQRRPYTASVDVWSLGCTVLELATGRRPWHDHTAMGALVAMARARHPPLPPGLSPQCRSFLAACWVWEPTRRPSPAHLRRHPFLAKAQPVAPSGGEGE